MGWTDTVSAMGVVAFPNSVGFSRTVYIPSGYRDIIPADFVSNSVIATTAYIGSQPEPCFHIFHNTSTGYHKCEIMDFFDRANEFVKFNPSEKQIRDPVFR